MIGQDLMWLMIPVMNELPADGDFPDKSPGNR
jgi:hypothetical protein